MQQLTSNFIAYYKQAIDTKYKPSYSLLNRFSSLQEVGVWAHCLRTAEYRDGASEHPELTALACMKPQEYRVGQLIIYFLNIDFVNYRLVFLCLGHNKAQLLA